MNDRLPGEWAKQILAEGVLRVQRKTKPDSASGSFVHDLMSPAIGAQLSRTGSRSLSSSGCFPSSGTETGPLSGSVGQT